MRLIGLLCLFWAVQYWDMVLGVTNTEMHFDLLEPWWQVAAASLAVLMPVAAVGLWMTVSWGPVVWFVAAAIQVTMHYVFPHLFGERPILLALYIMVIALYAAFRLVLMIQKRERRMPVTNDLP